MTQSIASTIFTVEKIVNNFEVKVEDGVYGHDVAITVIADVNGDYAVDINSRIITVYVENGQGTITIDDFGEDNYIANVSFANDNYINNATNCTFTVQKGQSHVVIVGLDLNVTLNQNTSIRFTDFYPAKYNVTIYDENQEIIKSEIQDSLLYSVLISNVGTYNMTVTNLGNANVTGSTSSVVFNVNTDNYVDVIVEDSEYGKELYIAIFADVDGDYIVDLNGTNVTIEVTDGIGEFWDLVDIDAGDYTTKVIFDNPNYINNINNADFTIYPVESNIKIYEIGNVTYGEDVYVRFHENYPTEFIIEVLDSNDNEVINTTFVYEDTNPEMSVILAGLDVGKYMVAIENLGVDVNILPNSSFMYFNVEKQDILITVDPIQVFKYKDNVTISGKVTDVNGKGLYNINAIIEINGKLYKAKTNRTGAFTFSKLANPAGINNVTVSYAGNANYNGYSTNTTFNVEKQDINITINPITDTIYNNNVTITGKIIDLNSYVLKNINALIKINGKLYKAKTDNTGAYTFTTPATVLGTNNLTVGYGGNTNYNGFEIVTTFNVIAKRE